MFNIKKFTRTEMNTVNNLMKVLIVEDESAIRNLISTALETNGYNFEMATNGSRALSLLVKHQFDIFSIFFLKEVT